MNISLPETLKSFVDQQVAGRGFGTSSEYVRELIRKDQDANSDGSGPGIPTRSGPPIPTVKRATVPT